MQTNSLLYGFDPLERIVSVEIKDNNADVFIEEIDGTVTRKQFENRHWILASKQIDPTWEKLDGDLHYKYIQHAYTDEEYYRIKREYKYHDLFSISNAKERFLTTKGFTYHKGMKHNEISVLSFDIETTTLLDKPEGAKVLIIANTFRKNGIVTKKMFCYDEYNSQGEMLEAWCQWVYDIDPSVITGHNVCIFDLPYLDLVAKKEKIKLKLGRNKWSMSFEKFESKFRKDASQFYHYHKPKIYGREIVDTFFSAVKSDVGRKYENYKLKNIIKQEGLEKKNRTFYDADKIRYNYKDPKEWELIKAYAKDDGDDGLALYDLFSPPFFYSAQIIPKPYQLITESAEGSKINSIMVRAYIQEAHSLPKESPSKDFEGAISIGNPGIYKNVFKIDVASLYPSIMIEWEIFDEAKDPEKYFLSVVKDLTEQRLTNKKLAKETKDPYYSGLEQSQKVLINSCYGFLGAEGLLFNSPDKAEFVTGMGRDILKTCMEWSKKGGFTLVNADTDSISFCRPNGEDITKEERQGLLNEVNSLFPSKIKWEDDGYYKKVIAMAAKNYVLVTEDDKIKYKGSALKATNKEPALKQFIKDLIDAILNDNKNYAEIYNNYVKQILNITDIKPWASKKTVTENVLKGTRTNETKVVDAIKDSEYLEGDKIYVYFKEDCSLGLAEKFDGKYNKEKLLEKLYKTATSDTLVSIIPKDTFINYSLKRSKKLLEELK